MRAVVVLIVLFLLQSMFFTTVLIFRLGSIDHEPVRQVLFSILHGFRSQNNCNFERPTLMASYDVRLRFFFFF